MYVCKYVIFFCKNKKINEIEIGLIVFQLTTTTKKEINITYEKEQE